LFAHASGQWAKKIRGKMHYFGAWADPDAALKKYLEQKDDLHAGRKPRSDPEALTVKDAANAFLIHKMELRDAGELSPRTWTDYKEVCDLLVSAFGKARLVSDLGPDDFAGLRKKMTKRWGPVRLGNAIQRVRSVFKFAEENDLTDRRVRFGQAFQRPSAKVLRLHRAQQGPKLFTREEILLLLLNAPAQLEAMILLGINCGFGIADCGRLPLSALDLERGWLDYPRPKTGIARRCPLWPETVEALREALVNRTKPKSLAVAELVFLTRQGTSWHKEDMSSPLVLKVRKQLRRLGINGRKGLGFYTLRHTFRTVADDARDQPAADHLMGHARADMSSAYRETISDARLKAVADHVRAWLFPPEKAPAGVAAPLTPPVG
jgi:integrase